MTRLSTQVVSTYAEFMICPLSIQGISGNKESLIKKGEDDFLNYKYIHTSDSYTGSSLVDESILLDRIKQAVLKAISNSLKEPLLLLSDGKDSMGLALALSSAGVFCKTLTFLRTEDVALKSYIEKVTKDLGHTPYFVTVDEIQSSYDSEFFLTACASMENPVLDQGFLFFLFGCRYFFNKNGFSPSEFVLIDGLGNDEHFGYLPSSNQKRSFQISNFGFWDLLPIRRLPFLRWYFRSPAESHGDLSALSAFFFFGKSIDLNQYFANVPRSNHEIPFVDFRAFSRGSFHDHQCMMGKTVTAANAMGCDVVFPWTDSDLADYCFNLPVSAKFDFNNLENKLLLRSLLSKSIGWSQEKRGVDLYFDLNISLFRQDVLERLVPVKFINQIDKSCFVSRAVKQRAYLELLNFYGYCKSHGYADDEIESILYGC